MAIRGTKKELSVRHEQYIEKIFDGRRSKSSGASDHDKGDVSTDTLVFECKMTMTEKIPTTVKQFNKVASEAYAIGKTPMLALRYYDPTNKLADRNGWVDFVMMLATDAVEREEALNAQAG